MVSSTILRTYHRFLFPTGSIQIFFQPPKRIGITRGTTPGHTPTATAGKTPTVTPTITSRPSPVIRISISISISIISISIIIRIILRIREWCYSFSERSGFGPGKFASGFGPCTIIIIIIVLSRAGDRGGESMERR